MTSSDGIRCPAEKPSTLKLSLNTFKFLSLINPPNLCPNLVSIVLIGSANSVLVSNDWNFKKLSISVESPNFIVTLPFTSVQPCGL